jgi:hypothetical protein
MDPPQSPRPLLRRMAWIAQWLPYRLPPMTAAEIHSYRRDAGLLDSVPDYKRAQANADFIRDECGIEYTEFLPSSGKIAVALP